MTIGFVHGAFYERYKPFQPLPSWANDAITSPTPKSQPQIISPGVYLSDARACLIENRGVPLFKERVMTSLTNICLGSKGFPGTISLAY
jgi:hypothetical protein